MVYSGNNYLIFLFKDSVASIDTESFLCNIMREPSELLKDTFAILKELKRIETSIHSSHTRKHEGYHKDLRLEKIKHWQKLTALVKEEEKMWGHIASANSEYIKKRAK